MNGTCRANALRLEAASQHTLGDQLLSPSGPCIAAICSKMLSPPTPQTKSSDLPGCPGTLTTSSPPRRSCPWIHRSLVSRRCARPMPANSLESPLRPVCFPLVNRLGPADDAAKNAELVSWSPQSAVDLAFERHERPASNSSRAAGRPTEKKSSPWTKDNEHLQPSVTKEA